MKTDCDDKKWLRNYIKSNKIYDFPGFNTSGFDQITLRLQTNAFAVSIQAAENAIITFSEDENVSNPTLQITLGAYGNTEIIIKEDFNFKASFDFYSSLSDFEMTTFYFRWSSNMLSVVYYYKDEPIVEIYEWSHGFKDVNFVSFRTR